MQPTVQETDQNHKMRVDEDSITFRPSPNFKHMKKYLKSKFEEEHQNHLNSIQEKDASNQHCDFPQRKTTANQPPLPVNPPPPTTCFPMLIPKKEIEEYDVQSNGTDDSSESILSDDKKSTTPTKENEAKETMCRNYLRGTCKRGTACRFAHKLIISQLPGVYTFCNNFQNSVCTLPQCRFVHATVFEKENFYRTGFLPPHTLSHLKFLTPPPTIKDPNEDFVFSKPPPKIRPCAMPVRVVIPSSKPDAFQGVPSLSSPVKRPSSDSNDFSSSPRDLESSEPLAKKCKSCDSNQFRYLYNKNKLEKMLRTSEEMSKKFTLLNKKMMKLCTVISVLFKPMVGNKSVNGISNIGLNGDKDKTLLEPFNFFLSANNRLNLIDDDGSKKSSFSNLLAKLLLNNSDPTKSPQRKSPSDLMTVPSARSSQR